MSEFPGYRPPTSNTTWMLNQLFEIVMPNSTEGCWRLVAHMARKHYGWCDEYGNPLEGEFEFPILKLASVLHVSEKTVRNAITEALEKKFIRCIRQGQKKTKGSSGCQAVYTLNFDRSGRYAKTIEEFDGFYTGEGHRTAVPDEFFDTTIFTEKFPTVKVIGAIFRYTIGFQAERGYRRQVVQISMRKLQELTGIGGLRHLHAAIKDAAEKRYLKTIAGSSVKDSPTPQAASYQILWSDAWDGSKPAPAVEEEEPPEIEGDDHGKKGNSDGSGKKGKQLHGKKGNRNPVKREADDHGKKGNSTVNTSPGNDSRKEQQQHLNFDQSGNDQTPDPAVVDFLISVGFLVHDAKAIAPKTTLDDAKYCWEQSQRDGIKNTLAYCRSLIEKGVTVPAPTLTDRKEEHRRSRAEHEDRFKSVYEEWLMEMAERIREEENPIYRVFCEQQENEPFRQRMRKEGKASYDERCPVGNMLSFVRHLEELGRLPGFWEWDKKYNSEGFEHAA